MKVALVGCGAAKLGHRAAAQDLYTGNLFRAARAYAERFADSWFILSAKHGLVAPPQVLEPYNATLVGAPREVVQRWSLAVSDSLRRYVPASALVVFLAGEAYSGAVTNLPNKVEYPLSGLGMGKRIAYMQRAVRGARRGS